MPKCTAPVKGHHSALPERPAPCVAHTRGAARTQAQSYAHTPETPGTLKSLVSARGAPTAAARSARLTGSAAGGDLIFWLLLANLCPRPFLAGVLRSTRDRFPSSARFAVDMDQQWNVTLPTRPRAGFLQRCYHHTRVMMTQYGAAAAVAIAIAVVNALVLWAALHREPSRH